MFNITLDFLSHIVFGESTQLYVTYLYWSLEFKAMAAYLRHIQKVAIHHFRAWISLVSFLRKYFHICCVLLKSIFVENNYRFQNDFTLGYLRFWTHKIIIIEHSVNIWVTILGCVIIFGKFEVPLGCPGALLARFSLNVHWTYD